uniref:Uncharacterized protein n=2 Tax=Cryptococcus bacillisporus CA1280 TaxID=1296109 RepID=A0A0D0VHL3_CRYGA|nr:hypothetical protein I312_06509 [Cryptococcus bacillisporus CA1280]
MKDAVPTVRSTPEAAKCKGHPMVTSNPKDQGKANSSNKEHFSAVARRGPKPAVQNYLPPPIEEEVKPRSKNKRGWVDRNGNPLPDAPPRKKSIINIIEEKEAQEEKKAKKKAQAKEKRNRTIQAKKKKKNEEKIEFGLLPKGAGPTEEYPILLALEKQKSLPIKSQAKLKNGEITRSPRPTYSIVEDIDDLVDGRVKTRNDQGNTAADPITLDHSSEISGHKIRSDGSTSTLIEGSKANKSCGSVPLSRFSVSNASDQRSSLFKKSYPLSNNREKSQLGRLGSPMQPWVLETPRTDDTIVNANSMEHPSTMTRVPSSMTPAGDKSFTTTSGLPYSSPLAGRGKMTGHTVEERWKGKGKLIEHSPEPHLGPNLEGFKSLDVERLERAAETYQSKQTYSAPSPVIARPIPRPFQPLLPIRPFQPPSRSPSPIWSTLPAPTKRKLPSSSSPSKASKTYTSNKFRVPSLFPIPHKRSDAQPPSSPGKVTRLTLFSPTSKGEDARRPISERTLYTIKTIRGTTYGPSFVRNEMPGGTSNRTAGIKGRLTLPPGRSGGLSGTHSGGISTRWEKENDQQTQVSQNEFNGYLAYDYRDYRSRAGQTGDNYDDGHECEADGDEMDWQSAWKGRSSGGTETHLVK